VRNNKNNYDFLSTIFFYDGKELSLKGAKKQLKY